MLYKLLTAHATSVTPSNLNTLIFSINHFTAKTTTATGACIGFTKLLNGRVQ
nr:hypothetical protein [uncultured Flavobacterium sp.]